MIMVDFIVKLGGSAVTVKDEFEQINREGIQKAANVLSTSWKNGFKFIIVHGAGSFGHQIAKKYKVKGGWHGSSGSEREDIAKGFALTRISVCKLNSIIVQELVAAGIPAVAQSPCGMWVTAGDKMVKSHPLKNINDLLHDGFIPILHGDCILDTKQGCTILSGDTICEVLCDFFQPKQVVFASDVLGIFNKPPEIEGSILMEEIEVNQNGMLSVPISCSSKDYDVTGGIKFKVETAMKILLKSNGSVQVIICGLESNAFKNICNTGGHGEEPCTILKIKDL